MVKKQRQLSGLPPLKHEWPYVFRCIGVTITGARISTIDFTAENIVDAKLKAEKIKKSLPYQFRWFLAKRVLNPHPKKCHKT